MPGYFAADSRPATPPWRLTQSISVKANGTAVTGDSLGNPGPTWHIKAEGDFYGNGDPDVVRQNDGGGAAIWETMEPM
jgi:hypothetical protein